MFNNIPLPEHCPTQVSWKATDLDDTTVRKLGSHAGEECNEVGVLAAIVRDHLGVPCNTWTCTTYTHRTTAYM